jgi:hypothetical protein
MGTDVEKSLVKVKQFWAYWTSTKRMTLCLHWDGEWYASKESVHSETTLIPIWRRMILTVTIGANPPSTPPFTMQITVLSQELKYEHVTGDD